MAKQRSSFAKLQRDKAKKERSAERLANRQKKNESRQSDDEVQEVPVSELVSGEGEPSPEELLSIVEDLNSRKEAGKITEEEFEEAKVELFTRLG